MKPINRATAEHYTWGQKCDGWHLVKDAHLSVIQEQMPPDTNEVRHFHQKAQQLFFILSGEAALDVEGKEVILHSGDGLHVSPGMSHQIRNVSDRPVEFLVISQPSSHGDRVSS